MTARPLVVLLSLLAASPAPAAQVEVAADPIATAAPSAAPAAAPLPLALLPSPLSAASFLQAAPVPLAAPALSAAMPAAAAAPAGASVLIPAAAAGATSRAAAPPAPRGDGSRPTLLQTASAPLPDMSKMSGAESSAAAGADFAARAQLEAPSAAPAFAAASLPEPPARALPTLKPASRPSAAGPVDARQMETALIPAWIKEELPVAAAKLGRELPPAYEADVLARSKVWVYKWHSRWTYEVPGGLPDGHFDPKFGIRVMLKTDWRRLKDPETHFRVLFAHEYTHWLQNEGLVTNRYGGEIPAVAVEQLRAYELVGLEGMKAGRVGFIAEGNLLSFEHGREWARGDMKDESMLYFRGVLGGAAYEVGRIAGRPEAAWEFLNLVIAEKGGLKPREAFERVTGVKK